VRDQPVEIIEGEPGAAPTVSIVDAQERTPWGGHMGRHALPEIYNIIRQHKTSIVFVPTPDTRPSSPSTDCGA